MPIISEIIGWLDEWILLTAVGVLLFFVWVYAGYALYALFFVLVAVGYTFWLCIKFLLGFDESSEEVGSKETTPTIAEMNPKLPTSPPDLWKN